VGSVSLSLLVGLTATALSLPPALATAWFLERTRARTRGVVQTLVMLPLVLPPVVLGYLLLKIFSPRGVLGQALAGLGTPVAFHWLGAVIAASVVGFPLFVMSISLAMKSVDLRLERISRSLGRSRWETFWKVTLPLSWPGILAGRIPGQTETIPLAIYAELDSPGGENRIVGLVAASLLLCLICVLAARALDRWHAGRLELDR